MKKCKYDGDLWFDNFWEAKKSLLRIIQKKCNEIANEAREHEDDEILQCLPVAHSLLELNDINKILIYLNMSKSILDDHVRVILEAVPKNCVPDNFLKELEEKFSKEIGKASADEAREAGAKVMAKYGRALDNLAKR